ncbi:MAG TPA: hypothetical protein VJ044_16985 [Candidatus Hodarchaeales archaeon]|nr:hypothetical protein [Candidatus Hodarchaeales archaeon]
MEHPVIYISISDEAQNLTIDGNWDLFVKFLTGLLEADRSRALKPEPPTKKFDGKSDSKHDQSERVQSV